MAYADPKHIKNNQAKLLLDDESWSRFDAISEKLGIHQKCTANRELTMLAVEVAELYQSEASCPKAVLFALHRDLMELDILRMEQASQVDGAQSKRA